MQTPLSRSLRSTLTSGQCRTINVSQRSFSMSQCLQGVRTRDIPHLKKPLDPTTSDSKFRQIYDQENINRIARKSYVEPLAYGQQFVKKEVASKESFNSLEEAAVRLLFLADEGSTSDFEELLNNIQSRGLKLPSSILTDITNTLWHRRRSVLLLSFVRKYIIAENLTTTPEIMSCTAKALVSSNTSEDGVEVMNKIMKEMPDEVGLYNSVLTLYEARKEYHTMDVLRAQMNQRGVKPNRVTMTIMSKGREKRFVELQEKIAKETYNKRVEVRRKQLEEDPLSIGDLRKIPDESFSNTINFKH